MRPPYRLLLLALALPATASANDRLSPFRDAARLLETRDPIEQVGATAVDGEVRALVELASTSGSPLAAGLRAGHQDHLEALPAPPLYVVEARIDPEQQRVEARQAVVWTHRGTGALDSIVLRLYPHALLGDARVWIREIRVGGLDATWTLEDTLLRVQLPAPVEPGGTVRLTLRLDEAIPTIAASTDPTRGNPEHVDGRSGHRGGVTVLGSWLPVVLPRDDAEGWRSRPLTRNGDHTWYEPASYHVTLNVPAGLALATSGVEIGRRPAEEGRERVVFVAPGVREFSAILASGYAERVEEVDGMRVRVLHPAGDAAVGEHLLRTSVASVRVFSEAFGPLPFRELELVDAPMHGPSGIEFHGLATVGVYWEARDNGLQPTPETVRQLYYGFAADESTIVHEVAHQWWHAEVGNDAIGTPWLDESLSSFSEKLYWQAVHGPTATELMWNREVRLPYQWLREAGATDMRADLSAAMYPPSHYGAVVYAKGAAFFDALRIAIGPSTFQEGLRRYYADRHCGFADADALLAAFVAAGAEEETVRGLHRHWIQGSHGIRDLGGR